MKEKLIKMFKKINLSLVFFAAFLSVILFDLDVKIALIIYSVITFIDVLIVIDEKKYKQVMYNFIALIGLFVLFIFVDRI